MNRKTLFVIMAAVLMVSLAAAGSLAMGFSRVRMGHFVNNEDAKAAIESDNYNAFIQAIQSSNMMHKNMNLTEHEFNSLVQRYRQEYPVIKSRQSAEQAIKNNDYTAWESAMTNLIEAQKAQITKENFDKIVEKHQEMQSNNSTMIHKGRSFGRGRHKIKIIE